MPLDLSLCRHAATYVARTAPHRSLTHLTQATPSAMFRRLQPRRQPRRQALIAQDSDRDTINDISRRLLDVPRAGQASVLCEMAQAVFDAFEHFAATNAKVEASLFLGNIESSLAWMLDGQLWVLYSGPLSGEGYGLDLDRLAANMWQDVDASPSWYNKVLELAVQNEHSFDFVEQAIQKMNEEVDVAKDNQLCEAGHDARRTATDHLLVVLIQMCRILSHRYLDCKMHICGCLVPGTDVNAGLTRTKATLDMSSAEFGKWNSDRNKPTPNAWTRLFVGVKSFSRSSQKKWSRSRVTKAKAALARTTQGEKVQSGRRGRKQ